MKKYIVLTFFLCCSFLLSAQYYDTSIGLRAGTGFNASGKMFLSELTAVEGIVGLYSFGKFNAIGLTALYQIHNPINNRDHQLSWYYGGGGTVITGNQATAIGINGNIGIEYVFQDLPINFSIDAIPTFFFGNDNGFDPSFSAAIRYILQ